MKSEEELLHFSPGPNLFLKECQNALPRILGSGWIVAASLVIEEGVFGTGTSSLKLASCECILHYSILHLMVETPQCRNRSKSW